MPREELSLLCMPELNRLARADDGWEDEKRTNEPDGGIKASKTNDTIRIRSREMAKP